MTDECCPRCGVPGPEHETLEECGDAQIKYYADEERTRVTKLGDDVCDFSTDHENFTATDRIVIIIGTGENNGYVACNTNHEEGMMLIIAAARRILAESGTELVVMPMPKIGQG